MKVILLADVKKLGKTGDIVEVAEGYARNYLFPKGIAKEATSGSLRDLDLKKQDVVRKKEKELADARALGQKISGVEVTIKTKTGETGKLFGSVTSKEIADQLATTIGVKIDKRKIELKEPIKTLGSYEVSIKVHPEVTAKVKVHVTADTAQ